VTCPDTSVIVPALSQWHEDHERARHVVGRPTQLVGHCLIETYSVLTRLPEPYRTPPDVAAVAIGQLCADCDVLAPPDGATVVQRLREAGVAGGATYDGLIAINALDHGATILTLDARAVPTYRAIGAPFRLIGA